MDKNVFKNTAERLKQWTMFIKHFCLKNSFVYLFRAVLCKLIVELHKYVLFHSTRHNYQRLISRGQ